MFDYKTTQADVAELLADMGVKVTLEKATGATLKTFILWGASVETDSTTFVSHITTAKKTLYMAGNVRRIPEVGDTIKAGAIPWSIDGVEAYMPASTVIAYKVTVTS